jgi:hypothetical protein
MQFSNLIGLEQEIEQLDEPVERSIEVKVGTNLVLEPRKFKAIVSARDYEVLSVVSSRYSIVQSKDVLRSVVSALAKLGINDVKGSLIEQNGRTFARILLPKFISEGNSEKDIQLGFLLINSYDATHAISIQGFAMRQVCSNGMIAPKALGTAFVKKHIGHVNLKVEDAVKNIIAQIVDRSPYLTEMIEEAAKDFYEDYDEMENALVANGFSKKTSEKILYRLEGIKQKYSRWDLYNAITNFYSRRKIGENGRVQNLKKAEALLVPSASYSKEVA